jgi:ribosome-binding factor A
MTGRRGSRVGQRIQEIVARLLHEEIRDPRIGFITVTGVELSRDLRLAKVFVAAHGSEAERRGALEGLRSAAPFVRRALGRELALRFTPEVAFFEDQGVERGSRVESILRDLHQGNGPEDPEEPGP